MTEKHVTKVPAIRSINETKILAAIERGAESAILLSRKDHLTSREAAKLFSRSESYIKKIVKEKKLTRI